MDAGHTCEHVKADAVTAFRKLRPRGLLVFNGYVIHDDLPGAGPGMVHAVNELVLEQDAVIVGFGPQRSMFCEIAVLKTA